VLTESFSGYWREMQREYEKIMRSFSHEVQLENNYMHPHWRQQRKLMAQIIQGAPDDKIMMRGPVAGSMVRNEFCKTQEYEMAYLRHCVPKHIQALLRSFKDTQFGGIQLLCREFNCSINSLGQLFFLARILERNKIEDINTIIELGGGYGCLARIAKMVLPSVTYVILDLPEYIALQSLYLRSTLPDIKVVVHTACPEKLETGTINLVPIFFLPNFTIRADIFLSFAALSETPEFVQKMVIERKFFNAYASYLTGPLNRWGAQYNFENHHIIVDGMRSCYNLCFAQPMHHFGGKLQSYDIYGTNQVK